MKQLLFCLSVVTAVGLTLISGHSLLRSGHSLPASGRSLVKNSVVPAERPPAVTAVTQTQADAAGLQFTLTTPPFQLMPAQQIAVDGLGQQINQPGAPALPYYATLIALPPAAVASVTVTAHNVQQQPVSGISPAPHMRFARAEDIGLTAAIQQAFIPDETIYSQDALYPSQRYSLSEPMYYRDMRLVALQLYPVQYNPVSGVLQQAQELRITVRFSGADFTNLRPAPTANTHFNGGLDPLILNAEAAHTWRTLPPEVLQAATTELPLGTDTYKISLNEDGIYQVCQEELEAAGMDVASVNPADIQMLYRGEPVSYQFIGDADASFESGECVRFFGWAFAGPRTEKQFVTENIYWLWAGGNPSTITSTVNSTTGTIKRSVWFTETREPELSFFSTWTDDWPEFDNEPDAWYWDRIGGNTSQATYTITVPHPDLSAPTFRYLAEFTSRANNDFPDTVAYTVTTSFNNSPTSATRGWTGRKNYNIGQTLATTYLLSQTNDVHLQLDMEDHLYLNRITVEYMRFLNTDTDQLLFTDEAGGNPLAVAGFSSDQALVWEVTDPLHPTAVEMNGGVSGANPYTYTFGLDHPAGTRFIATTAAQLKPVLSISQYTPASLNPADLRADWVAITHPSLLTETLQLAAHRGQEAYGGLDTHVVLIDDLINQYGYGLPLPTAVHDYLTYALGNWIVAPSYVVMVGDATVNPRQLDCLEGCATWDITAPHLVLTDLQFVDRYQGLVPTDNTFVMLAGNDVLPDMAIGRIAAETAAHVSNALNKISVYEDNPYQGLPAQFLFVADNNDDGGFFCQENAQTIPHIIGYPTESLCMGTPAYPDVNAIRAAMFPRINGGLHVLNYRGHGSVNRWATELIMTTDDITSGWWDNAGKPNLILSADCLDGHFAWPGLLAISETSLRYDLNDQAQGSAGMWSSSGLGLTSEHTVLHKGFYDGLFQAYGRTFGNAANYAKVQYMAGNNHESEVYTFIVHGDPAMLLYWAPEPPPPNLYPIYLPFMSK